MSLVEIDIDRDVDLRRLERGFFDRAERKTRNAAREGIGVRVENNHGRLEQNIGFFSLLLPMELMLLEEKRRKFCFQNSQRKAQVAQSWPKKDKKGYLKSEPKGGW